MRSWATWSVDASNVLLEPGSQLLGDITLAGNAALTSRGQTRRLLSADASAITLENGAEQQGDIRLDNGASLTSQGLTEGLLSADASIIILENGALQQGEVRLDKGAMLTSQGGIVGNRTCRCQHAHAGERCRTVGGSPAGGRL
ncbi:hypothetical protein ACM3C4_01515 [Edwardsiella ictaluri]